MTVEEFRERVLAAKPEDLPTLKAEAGELAASLEDSGEHVPDWVYLLDMVDPTAVDMLEWAKEDIREESL